MFGKWVRRRKGFWATSHLWWRSWRRDFSEADGTGVRPITGAQTLGRFCVENGWVVLIMNIWKMWTRLGWGWGSGMLGTVIQISCTFSMAKVVASSGQWRLRSSAVRQASGGENPDGEATPKSIQKWYTPIKKRLKKIEKDTPWYSHLH
jgi:hypothetical protein